MFPAMKSLASALTIATLLAASPALAAVGDWGKGSEAAARLIAAGIGADGKLAAGIEIALPPDWHTYWRSPGDAGVSPVIDFTGSANVAATAVAFPAPTRLDDGYSVTNVYEHGIVLPLTATVADPAKPVDLSVDLKIGVCKDICVPDEIKASLTVPAGESDAATAAALATAAKAVPGPSEAGVFAFDAVARDGGTDRHPVFRFDGVVPDAKNAVVFVEGPADWAPFTPAFAGESGGKASWTVEFSRLGAKSPIPGAAFRLTVVSAGRAIDQTLTLD